MFAGVRAIATALAMVSVSCAAVAQGVPPGAQIVPPSDQPGRERERFERPAVPLAPVPRAGTSFAGDRSACQMVKSSEPLLQLEAASPTPT